MNHVPRHHTARLIGQLSNRQFGRRLDGQVPDGRTGQRSTGGRRLDDLLTRGGPEHDRDLGSGWPGQGVSVVRGEGAEAEERLRRADDEERRPR